MFPTSISSYRWAVIGFYPRVVTGYHHVDVFSAVPYGGNSLAVFIDPPPLTAPQMARITQELRHFETVFVSTSDASTTVRARVFDLADELDFAGHPLLGAAGVLHTLTDVTPGDVREWTFELPAKTVRVSTRRHADGHVSALMDQGRPEWVREPAPADPAVIAAALNLDTSDLDPTLPLEVVSTGLRYLVVAVRGDALARARIIDSDFTSLLGRVGAEFCYLLDAEAMEGRHWNNDGVLEDVATGSAAGCVIAYLMKHERARHGEEVLLHQGRFLGRPSTLSATAYGSAAEIERVAVGGDVALVGTGTLRTLPPPAET